MLSALLFIPFMGLSISEKTDVTLMKLFATSTITWITILTVVLWAEFDSSFLQYQFVQELNSLSFCNFNVGIDGISMYFVLLTAFITPLCIFANSIKIKFGMKYFITFLLTSAVLITVFALSYTTLLYISYWLFTVLCCICIRELLYTCVLSVLIKVCFVFQEEQEKVSLWAMLKVVYFLPFLRLGFMAISLFVFLLADKSVSMLVVDQLNYAFITIPTLTTMFGFISWSNVVSFVIPTVHCADAEDLMFFASSSSSSLPNTTQTVSTVPIATQTAPTAPNTTNTALVSPHAVVLHTGKTVPHPYTKLEPVPKMNPTDYPSFQRIYGDFLASGLDTRAIPSLVRVNPFSHFSNFVFPDFSSMSSKQLASSFDRTSPYHFAKPIFGRIENMDNGTRQPVWYTVSNGILCTRDTTPLGTLGKFSIMPRNLPFTVDLINSHTINMMECFDETTLAVFYNNRNLIEAFPLPYTNQTTPRLPIRMFDELLDWVKYQHTPGKGGHLIFSFKPSGNTHMIQLYEPISK